VRPNRAISNSSLAFIDVMSCGLGAVILLFILLDFNQPSYDALTSEVLVVNEEDANSQLTQRRVELIKAAELEKNNVQDLVSAVSDALIVGSQKAVQLELIARASTPKFSQPDDLDMPASGELLGMNIKGSRILIAFDTSASMSNENLIDIIVGISDSSGKRLGMGKKWLQAKRTLLWVIKNAPKNTQIQVIGYSDTVKNLTQGWATPKDTLIAVERELKAKWPKGGTSLGAMLDYVEDKRFAADSIYIITDGLPTIVGKKNTGLRGFKECLSLGSGKNSYIDGECRAAMFIGAVQQFQKTSTSVINVILLPLEGDPKAAPFYGYWANSTKGILFSPARGWPPK